MFAENYYPKKEKRTQKGMSLIETMLALCLIAILIGLSGISFQALWHKYNLKLSAREVKSRLEFIRLKSILDKETYEVKIDGTFLLHNLSSEEKFDSYKLNVNIAYFPQKKIACKFYSNGFARGGTIILSSTDNEYCENVVVSKNGRIRIKAPGEVKCF